MSLQIETVTLYRAGDPSEGASFWSISEKHARDAHPEGSELHMARVLSTARWKRFDTFVDLDVVAAERARGDYDVLVFPSGSTHVYYVLTPSALKIIQ